MAARAGRSFVWPAAIALGITAAGLAYALPKTLPQAAIIEVQQPSGSIDDKVVVETPIAPQHIEKPATLQEMGGVEGVTKEYLWSIAKYAAQELGMPVDPNVTFNVLPEREYNEKVRQRNSQIIANSIGFTSSDGLNIYLKGVVEPSRLIGLATNETGKAQIGTLQKQKKVVMPSREMKLEIVEAAAFAYQAANQRFLEEKLGFEGFFTPPGHYEVEDLVSQFMNRKKAYQQQRNVTHDGFMIFTYVVFNEPRFFEAAESLKRGERMTPEEEMQVFYFLPKQDDAYAKNAIDKIGEKEFRVLAEIIAGRKGAPLVQVWTYYDNKLP